MLLNIFCFFLSVQTWRQKLRGCRDEFVQYGFTKVTEKGVAKVQCISFNSILANKSLRPFKLLSHVNNVHGKVGTEDEIKRREHF